MAWTVRTIEPPIEGSNYTCLVEHPKDFVANDSDMTANNTGPDEYTIKYRPAKPGESFDPGVDVWDSSIPFWGAGPHTVHIIVDHGDGGTTDDRPEVADSKPGGPLIAPPKKYKVKRLKGTTTSTRTKLSKAKK